MDNNNIVAIKQAFLRFIPGFQDFEQPPTEMLRSETQYKREAAEKTHVLLNDYVYGNRTFTTDEVARKTLFQITRATQFQNWRDESYLQEQLLTSSGERVIEILPKTDEVDDATRRRLVEMLSIAGMLPHLEAGVASLAASAPSLLDAFMQAYVRQLTLEWRRGRISNYRKTDEDRLCLRGKLLFAEQLRRNLLRPTRFVTRADQFVTDVPASRLLKAGLAVCRRHGFSDATRRGATTLLAEFEDVSTQAFTDAELDRIKPDRQIARFEPLLTLAADLVRGCVPDRVGGKATFSLFFDMNAVFEQYIGRLLRSVCPPPFRVHLQATGRALALRDGKRTFWLRPDAAIRRGQEFAILLDTKWKLLDPSKPHEGVRQADMYQAYAYAREFTCPHVILLYPRFGGLDANVAAYRLRPSDDTRSCIVVRTVDISKSVAAVRQELKVLLAEVSQEPPPPLGSNEFHSQR